MGSLVILGRHWHGHRGFLAVERSRRTRSLGMGVSPNLTDVVADGGAAKDADDQHITEKRTSGNSWRRVLRDILLLPYIA